jgi:hypothetical protein
MMTSRRATSEKEKRMHRILVVMLCIVVSALAGTAVAQDLTGMPGREAAVSARQLDTVDVEGIKRALDGKTAAEVNALLPTLVPGDVAIKNGLGQANTDLVYVPVAPCRIIDTRLAGGKYAANQTRHYSIVGTSDYSSYGGNAAGCDIPGDTVSNPIDVSGLFIVSVTQKVRALVLNIVAVNPNGAGDIRAWPQNQTMPTASVLNYAAYSGLNLANGITVTSCDAFDFLFPYDPCPNGDVSFYAEAAGTHLVVDVAGYYIPATGYGKRRSAQNDDNIAIPAACTNLLSTSLANSSGYSRTVICTASVTVADYHAAGTPDILDTKISNVSGTTCPTFGFMGAAGETLWDVQASEPAGTYYNTLNSMMTFELNAGATGTYYLNAQTFSGSTTNSTGGQSFACFIP